MKREKRRTLERRGGRARQKRRDTREREPRWVENKTRIALALAVLAGMLEFVGFVGVFPLAWIALVPVLVAVRGADLGRTFLYGMVFGTIAHLGGYYWIAHMLEQFGGFPVPLAYLPAFVRRLWREAGPADALVNLTNDSWYGDSHEPWIHLALATFRSIETRRSLIRATNTGVSAIVDPAGRITAHTGQWTQETVVAEVPMVDGGSTTVYQVVGDALGWISCAAVIAGLALAWRAPA